MTLAVGHPGVPGARECGDARLFDLTRLSNLSGYFALQSSGGGFR